MTTATTRDTALAVVTGASTGIGYELAKRCARNGFDLLIAADEPRIETVAGLGFEATMRGEGEVITGWTNELRAAISHLMPAGAAAEQQRKMAAPGTAER